MREILNIGYWRCSSPIIIFVDLQWTLSSSTLSILSWGANAGQNTPDVASLGWSRGAGSPPSTCWPHYWALGIQPPSGCDTIHHYCLGFTIQSVFNSAWSVPVQATCSLLFWETLWKKVSNILQSSKYTGTNTNIHITVCMYVLAYINSISASTIISICISL